MIFKKIFIMHISSHMAGYNGILYTGQLFALTLF